MKAAVTDSGQAFSGAPHESEYAKRFTYAWQALSTTCGGVTISSPALSSTMMFFNEISAATVPHQLLQPHLPKHTSETLEIVWHNS
jgi:6-phosphogluconate dehydrogenase